MLAFFAMFSTLVWFLKKFLHSMDVDREDRRCVDKQIVDSLKGTEKSIRRLSLTTILLLSKAERKTVDSLMVKEEGNNNGKRRNSNTPLGDSGKLDCEQVKDDTLKQGVS